MRTLIRRSLTLVVLLLLLTPVAILAQSETARQIVELIFSEDDSSVKITETIESTARVSFTHDGQDYVMKVPVTIDIDETVPIADSVSATDAAARVGVFVITVIETVEGNSMEIGYDTLQAGEENKLVAVDFNLKNLSDETMKFAFWFRRFPEQSHGERVFGLDDMGRHFEPEKIFGCAEVNPGSTEKCTVVFEVGENVTIVQLEVYSMDRGVVPIPEVEEEEEEQEES